MQTMFSNVPCIITYVRPETCMFRGAFIAAVIASGIGQAAQAPQFRSDTAVVTIDVRVVDRNGDAVTNLTREEFGVTEDRVSQAITQFERQTFARQTEAAPQPPRWIVVVLGQGRIDAPFKSIAALEELVRDGLAPRDEIGVIGYNRWADFTTDHASVVSLLERYKARNAGIETGLNTYSSGLRRRTMSHMQIPDELQASIDAVFTAPGTPAREFAPPSAIGVGSIRGQDSRFTQARFEDMLHLYRCDRLLAASPGRQTRHIAGGAGSKLWTRSSVATGDDGRR